MNCCWVLRWCTSLAKNNAFKIRKRQSMLVRCYSSAASFNFSHFLRNFRAVNRFFYRGEIIPSRCSKTGPQLPASCFLLLVLLVLLLFLVTESRTYGCGAHRQPTITHQDSCSILSIRETQATEEIPKLSIPADKEWNRQIPALLRPWCFLYCFVMPKLSMPVRHPASQCLCMVSSLWLDRIWHHPPN